MKTKALPETFLPTARSIRNGCIRRDGLNYVHTITGRTDQVLRTGQRRTRVAVTLVALDGSGQTTTETSSSQTWWLASASAHWRRELGCTDS